MTEFTLYLYDTWNC